MKWLVLFLFCIASPEVLAEPKRAIAQAEPTVTEPGACLKTIIDSEEWKAPLDNELECLRNNPTFKEALAQLCTTDENELTPKFKAYQVHQEKHTAAGDVFRAAAEASRAESLETLQRIEKEWAVSGHRAEISVALNALDLAKASCTDSESLAGAGPTE